MRQENQNGRNDTSGVKFATGDLETDPFKLGRRVIRPFAAAFHDGNVTETWWGEDCVKHLVERCKRYKGIIYFHNGGNFDFHFLLPFLPVSQCKFLCIGKRIVQIKTPWGCEFRDSYAIIPKALKAYHKTEIDYAKFEEDVREKWKGEILSYLRDDVVDLHNMVSGFAKRFPLECTLASATFKLLQNEYHADTGRSDEGYDAKFRPFYFAGRVQFWRLGRVPHKVSTVDINSAFPYAMTLPHAHGFEFHCGVKMPKRHAEQSFFVIRCFSEGELPQRQKDGSVGFPIGYGTYWVTGWELLAALKLGKVRNLTIETCYTPSNVKDFSQFVNHFYGAKLAAKLAGDKEEEFFNKIVLNAGYGKMALNPRRFSEVAVTTIYDTPPEVDGKSKRQRKANAALAGWQVKWDDPERGLTFHSRSSYREGIDKFVNVATAASITGCVRAHLMMHKAKCTNVVYCDTDSIIAEDVSRLPFSDRLGDFKLEMVYDPRRQFGGTPAQFWIGGKKLYAGFGYNGRNWVWKKACKGVRLPASAIIAVCDGKERTWEAEAPTYSVFSPPRFIKRTIRRADKR